MQTTLIVTEKPDAALHLAEALSRSEAPRRINVDGVPFFEVRTDAQRIVVCSALGHLYAVAARDPGRRYPVWDFVWKPKHLVQRGQGGQERWIQAIAKVSREADRFIDACDFDVEGSLIGYTILKYACQGADRKAQRMKFSTLTETELKDAYAKPLPQLDFPLVFAGMCRHEVDWLFGINLSRTLTQSAYRLSGRYSTLSTGRVQGPTLRFLVEREREIETFVPTPYWVLTVKVDVNGRVLPAEYEAERLARKQEAQEVVQACAGKPGFIENLESSTYELVPPTPFDLSSLQNEAYRHFGLSPRISLGLAERLYLDQLISYPRTSSQKLPASIGYERIMKSLGQVENYRSETAGLLSSGSLIPNEGKKDDPAHPAIYPTGTIPRRQLQGREQKLFDLVVRRFLASFGAAAVKRSDKATVKVGKYHFLLRGSRLIEKGWTTLYKPYAKFEDAALPPLRVGQPLAVHEIKSEQKFTQPPPRYNPSSLLRKMEESEIGTKATRADIIETLYRRRYVTGQRMSATPLAFGIIEILTRYCPKVVDVTFTRELEAKMEQIELESETRARVVLEAVDYLKPIIEDLKSREREIGEELATIIAEIREESTTLFVPCPQCGSKLKILKNPRTRKRFIGCSGKWRSDCKFSLPLPQLGTLSLLRKLCPKCGFQLIQVRSRGRHPLVSCCRCYVTKVRGASAFRQTTVLPKPK
jgi:DNA topoisomerase-1